MNMASFTRFNLLGLRNIVIAHSSRRLPLHKYNLHMSACCSSKNGKSDSKLGGQGASFAELFEQDPLVQSGIGLTGQLVEGTVISVGKEVARVDIGAKFPALMTVPKWAKTKHSITEGDKLVVSVTDVEQTVHFLGDSSHTSMHAGRVAFVRPA